MLDIVERPPHPVRLNAQLDQLPGRGGRGGLDGVGNVGAGHVGDVDGHGDAGGPSDVGALGDGLGNGDVLCGFCDVGERVASCGAAGNPLDNVACVPVQIGVVPDEFPDRLPDIARKLGHHHRCPRFRAAAMLATSGGVLPASRSR